MQDGVTKVKTDADYKWERICFPPDDRNHYPENYKELYLEDILDTCDKIEKLYKSGPAWKLIKWLYRMGDLFYGFRYKMESYNEYAKRNGLEPIPYCNAHIPGSHNFNVFLECIDNDDYKWENVDELLKGYYLPMVQIVREFAKNDGLTPPNDVLIATRKSENHNTKYTFSIYKVRYIKDTDIPNGSGLLLPDYYSLGADLITPEEYHDMYIRTIPDKEIAETRYKEFIKKEYPVFVYIKTHMWEEPKKIILTCTKKKCYQD